MRVKAFVQALLRAVRALARPTTVQAIGWVGALLFGAACAVSWLQPLWVEQAARELVRIEVEQRVGEKVDSLSNSRLVVLAQKALGDTEAEIARKRQVLRDGVPHRVAQAMANFLDADCECRRRLAERMELGEAAQLSSLTQVQAQLQGLIEHAYASATGQLMREFRIFTGANALVFAVLALAAGWRRLAATQLLLAAAVLVGAAGLTAGLYLFEQNWLHTVVFNDYVGWAYASYLGVAVVGLADVLLNRARVTRVVADAIGQVVSSVAVPIC